MTRSIKANEPFQAGADKIGLCVTGSLPADLSFSVDGVTWAVKESIADANNVICNIPYHLYLKCASDCVITKV